MNKSSATKLFALTLFAALSIAFMAPTAQAGLPRDGGDLFMKYVGKIVTRVDVGPWGSWVWTSTTQICTNGLWSFDYTRSRTVTKTYWLAERWFSWAWVDNNIVYYERWKNFQGPFTYTITQRQMKQVYWFDRNRYDPRIPQAIQQVFYSDSLLWADWTGLNGVVDPGTGVPVISHRVFFDETLYYETGPHQPDGTDAMVIDLSNFPTGPHLIRIEATWANGTVSPNFLMIPLLTQDYLTVHWNIPGPALPAETGRRTRLPGALMVQNNFDEDRAVYFKLGDSSVSPDPNGMLDSFFDIEYRIDIVGNGTVVPAGAVSFFDVFVEFTPHTPSGLTFDTEMLAMDLVGLAGMAVNENGVGTHGHLANPGSISIVSTPGSQRIRESPTVALAGKDKVVLEGTGFPANSQVGLTGSFFDVFFDTIPTNSTGGFKYEWPVPIKFTAYGNQTFAAIDLNDGTAATANVTMNGPDLNRDGKVNLIDVFYVHLNFGKVVTMGVPSITATAAFTVIPLAVLWLYERRKRKP